VEDVLELQVQGAGDVARGEEALVMMEACLVWDILKLEEVEVVDVEANILSSADVVAVPRLGPAPGGSSEAEAATVCTVDLHQANREVGSLRCSTCRGSVETMRQ